MSNTAAALFEKRTRAFPLGPDKTSLFLGHDYRHAIEGLREDMRQGYRLLCLVGPAGSGKSMLLRTLRTQLPRGIISEISQPPLGGLLSRLAAGLGSDVAGADESTVQQRFQEYFATSRQQDSAVIQVIDDAESLTRDDLALLHRLFEPIQGQVLLVGQPPLLSLFSTDDGTQDETQPDRIYFLEPLSAEEVGAYIRHRLNEAGFDRELFMPEAIAAVNTYSDGLPRLINLLCFTALASSEFDVSTPITAECIHEAARQRMEIGNYPFARPPLAPGWRPIPPSPAAHNDGKPSRDPGNMDENIDRIVDEPRPRGGRSTRLGYGRMVLSLVAGVALGLAISRTSMVDGAGQMNGAPHDTGATMSRSLDFYLQRMKAGLVDMAEWVIAWAGPESTSVNNIGIAQGDMPSRSQGRVNPTATAGIQTPPAPPARPADVSSVNTAGHAAPEKPEEATSVAATKVAATASGHASDSSHTGQQEGKNDRAAPLTAAQRKHLADLYADRAQYDIQSDRLQDAVLCIQRGLRLVPNDIRLHELDRAIMAAIATRRNETPQQTATGRTEQKYPRAIPFLPVQVVPPRNGITRLSFQQTKYE